MPAKRKANDSKECSAVNGAAASSGMGPFDIFRHLRRFDQSQGQHSGAKTPGDCVFTNLKGLGDE